MLVLVMTDLLAGDVTADLSSPQAVAPVRRRVAGKNSAGSAASPRMLKDRMNIS
jgi:hypothetical protein